MNSEYLRTRSTQGKIIILMLGAIVLGAGIHSHFTSLWIKEGTVELDDGMRNPSKVEIKMYHTCVILNRKNKELKCPDITMERYFVATIIACFVLSLIGFLLGFKWDIRLRPMKHFDFAYHALASVALLTAGVLYIISAVQSYNIFFATGPNDDDIILFRKAEKIAVGALTCIQSLFYGIVAVIIVKSKLGLAINK